MPGQNTKEPEYENFVTKSVIIIIEKVPSDVNVGEINRLILQRYGK